MLRRLLIIGILANALLGPGAVEAYAAESVVVTSDEAAQVQWCAMLWETTDFSAEVARIDYGPCHEGLQIVEDRVEIEASLDSSSTLADGPRFASCVPPCAPGDTAAPRTAAPDSDLLRDFHTIVNIR